MKCRGKIKGLSIGWESKKPEVTLEVDATATELKSLHDLELSVELKRYRKKRSLDANAYYWQLCTKVAEALQISIAHTHNIMLRRYGQIEQIDGSNVFVVIPDTEQSTGKVDEAETYHVKPTTQVRTGKDGIQYRTYLMLRGSHDYDTKEMSRLIDGIVSEAKELGIETMTPDQLAEMMALYGK